MSDRDLWKFKVVDDFIVREIKRPEIGSDIWQREIVMDKDTFVEAFEKWCLETPIFEADGKKYKAIFDPIEVMEKGD